MPLSLRWVGDSDLDRVAETRLRCYAAASGELEGYRQRIRANPLQQPASFLLAEDGPDAVGTATSIAFTTWVRGSPLPCQGVAWVGTVRTRRRTGGGGSHGVASGVMHEVLRHARERGNVLSALMPFRASFYEHFGYGVVERRVRWTVPLAVLPSGAFESFRFSNVDDRPAIAAAHQRSVERGQLDMERSTARWDLLAQSAEDGFEIIDRAEPTGPVSSQLRYSQVKKEGKDYLQVNAHFADDPAALGRQLHFLGSLKDQYHAVEITLPADVPLNWLLKERQLPHRDVNHPTASARPFTRMQVRVLDHAKLLEAIKWPPEARGEAVIAVHETEGHVSSFRLSVEDRRATVRHSDATPDVECRDTVWAAVALGDLPAAQALRIGLIDVRKPQAVSLLAALSEGRTPFCEEYF